MGAQPTQQLNSRELELHQGRSLGRLLLFPNRNHFPVLGNRTLPTPSRSLHLVGSGYPGPVPKPPSMFSGKFRELEENLAQVLPSSWARLLEFVRTLYGQMLADYPPLLWDIRWHLLSEPTQYVNPEHPNWDHMLHQPVVASYALQLLDLLLRPLRGRGHLLSWLRTTSIVDYELFRRYWPAWRDQNPGSGSLEDWWLTVASRALIVAGLFHDVGYQTYLPSGFASGLFAFQDSVKVDIRAKESIEQTLGCSILQKALLTLCRYDLARHFSEHAPGRDFYWATLLLLEHVRGPRRIPDIPLSPMGQAVLELAAVLTFLHGFAWATPSKDYPPGLDLLESRPVQEFTPLAALFRFADTIHVTRCLFLPCRIPPRQTAPCTCFLQPIADGCVRLKPSSNLLAGLHVEEIRVKLPWDLKGNPKDPVVPNQGWTEKDIGRFHQELADRLQTPSVAEPARERIVKRLVNLAKDLAAMREQEHLTPRGRSWRRSTSQPMGHLGWFVDRLVIAGPRSTGP